MNTKERLTRLEEAVARSVPIETREPDDVDRLFESVENLAAALVRGECGRLLLLPPGETRLFWELDSDEMSRPLSEAETALIAPAPKNWRRASLRRLPRQRLPRRKLLRFTVIAS